MEGSGPAGAPSADRVSQSSISERYWREEWERLVVNRGGIVPCDRFGLVDGVVAGVGKDLVATVDWYVLK